ncbi:hypothetical protein Q9R29_08455 [Rothia sp. ARF10]|nr:hypothetical protein [Rothia sp. ARF10]
MGWILVQQTGVSRMQDVFLQKRARPWVAAGLGEEGWLFDAAGVTLADVCEQVAAGTVD